MIKNEKHGPSWKDCQELIEHIGATFSLYPSITVTWPIRPFGGQGLGRWAYGVGYRRPGDGALGALGAVRSFGPGGEFLNAPTALYNALLECQTRLEDRERRAKAQAAF